MLPDYEQTREVYKTHEGRVLTLRCCLGLSREEFADQLGVDESALRDWEHGKRQPLRRNREKLEAMLDYFLAEVNRLL